MRTLNTSRHSATAFASATCANVAVGFDILGFALEEPGDRVTLKRREDNKIVIEAIHAEEKLPLETSKNTASLVVQRLCQDLKLEFGFSLTIQKGIPLSSGMGGSAASAVAALVACNAFLDPPLPTEELVPYALLGEEAASGQPHPDNIVPCLFGGLTLIQSLDPIKIVSLPIPAVYCVLVHPHLQVSTQEARKILKEQLPLKDYVKQSANLAAFIAALYQNDLLLLEQSLSDILIEPQRAPFVPGFYKAKAAALQAGALGASFSGSGPTIFAFAKSREQAEKIHKAIQQQLANEQLKSDYWIAPIAQKPAHLIETA